MLIGQHELADFKSINEGLEYLMHNPSVEPKLTILAGVYQEKLHITLDNLVMNGIGNVEISGSSFAKELDTAGNEIGTFSTPTVYIEAKSSTFNNITFVNDAGQGEIVGQAVAVFVHADLVKFNQCRFNGFQDTVCIGPLPPKQLSGKDFPSKNQRRYFDQYRVLFNQCYIEGTIDYIFGGGNAIFNDCEIKSLKRLDANDEGYVTAASTEKNRPFGFTFYRCYFTCEEGTNNVYLGRPWREYSATEMIECKYNDHIVLSGWSEWDQHSPSIEGVRYSERYATIEETEKYKKIRVGWVQISQNNKNLEEIIDERFYKK